MVPGMQDSRLWNSNARLWLTDFVYPALNKQYEETIISRGSMSGDVSAPSNLVAVD
jgi:hypothetical protein